MEDEYEKFRTEHILPSGLTPEQAEAESHKLVETEYIKSFAQGLCRYYKDARSTGEKESVRANADGSEDLIDFDWQTGNETFIKQLLPSGQGRYAHLLLRSNKIQSN